jgi:phosphomevalonate kinase
MNEQTDQFRQGCRDHQAWRLLCALQRGRDLLGMLAKLAGIPIWTGALRRACRTFSERSDLAIKPSGAGGGDCAVALVSPELRGKLRDAWRGEGLRPLEIGMSEEGARIERVEGGTRP